MQFLAIIELATEQAAEDAESQRVRLPGGGHCGQIIVALPQHHTAYDGQHQPDYHPYNVVGRSRADALVYETLTEPHHQQAERHLPDAHYDAH